MTIVVHFREHNIQIVDLFFDLIFNDLIVLFFIFFKTISLILIASTLNQKI